MEDDEALLTALTTEQFVLQSARGVISSEATARAALYVGAVSSGLVALGFASQLEGDGFAVLLGAVLPAIVVLGEFTFVRLVEVSVEDMRYLRQIQRIRAYYRDLGGRANEFFPPADEGYQGLFRSMGLSETSRFQAWFTAASMVASINAIVAGAGVGLLVRRLGPPLAVAVVVAVVVTLAFVAAHVAFEQRRYERGLSET